VPPSPHCALEHLDVHLTGYKSDVAVYVDGGLLSADVWTCSGDVSQFELLFCRYGLELSGVPCSL